MNVAMTLRDARQQARLTQRQLAQRAGVPQSTVARIESGKLMPRVDLFDDLLRAAELRVALEPIPGAGVDRSQIRQLLGLRPMRRAQWAAEAAHGLGRFHAAVRRP
jgi:hypothetical protein